MNIRYPLYEGVYRILTMGRYNRKANCFRVGRTRGCRANYVVTFPFLDSTEGTGKNRKCHCLPLPQPVWKGKRR